MKVTMVGVTGSGKTSYMSGMYESLFVNSVDGFRIEPSVSEDASLLDALAEVGTFKDLDFAQRNFEWNEGTKKTTLWNFDLMYNARYVTTFNWIDYRGGVISDVLDPEASDQDEVNEVIENILMSNAVIILADSFLLTHYDNVSQAKRVVGADVIQYIFNRYQRLYPTRDLIFVIALTKCDSVGDEWKRDNYAPLIERGLEVFDGMQELCRLHPSWVGGIAPVSVVGEGNAEREVAEEGDLRTPPTVINKITQYPQPFNTENILFYCLGNTLIQMKRVAHTTIEQMEMEIEASLKKSRNPARTIWAWITGEPLPGKQAKQLREQLEQTKKALEEFEPFIDPLYRKSLEVVRRIV